MSYHSIIELLVLNRDLQKVDENSPIEHIERISQEYLRVTSDIHKKMSETFKEKKKAVMARRRRPPVQVENVAPQEQRVIVQTPIDLTNNTGSESESVTETFLQYADRRNREIRARREQERVEQERREQERREQERRMREEERRLQQIREQEERQFRYEFEVLQERQLQERQRQATEARRVRLTRKVKALKKSEIDTCVDSECSICLETPKIVDSSITNCGHKFCGGCLDHWVIETKKKTCPACRTRLTCIQGFKPRKTPVRRVAAVAVV